MSFFFLANIIIRHRVNTRLFTGYIFFGFRSQYVWKMCFS